MYNTGERSEPEKKSTFDPPLLPIKYQHKTPPLINLMGVRTPDPPSGSAHVSTFVHKGQSSLLISLDGVMVSILSSLKNICTYICAFCLYCRTRKMFREDWLNTSFLYKEMSKTTIIFDTNGNIYCAFIRNPWFLHCLRGSKHSEKDGPVICGSISSLSSYFKGATPRLNVSSFGVILKYYVEERRGPDQLEPSPGSIRALSYGKCI